MNTTDFRPAVYIASVSLLHTIAATLSGQVNCVILNNNSTYMYIQIMGTGKGILIQTYIQTHLYNYLTLYSLGDKM